MSAAVGELDAIARRLRRECPWDREQDERSIVSHTVEESYELADAIARGDDEALLDELGDVLFQVHFLSLLMEERGVGDMAAVAAACREKLIRRHPHVFGPQSRVDEGGGEGRAGATATGPEARTAGEVLRNWDRIKSEVEGKGEGGVFSDVPENLPALLYARKAQRRAASRAGGEGLAADAAEAARRAAAGAERVAEAAGQGADGGPAADPAGRDALERAIGSALFALVDLARQARVDPELALRAETSRFMED